MSLAELVRELERLRERDSASLLRRIRWTAPQVEFLRSTDPRPVLLRTGNQWLGKSTVGAADLLYRCQGDHPYDPRGRITPCDAIAVSPTDQHSIQLQGKVWELADKATLAAGQAYIPGKGMRGRHPILRFANGSSVHYRTGNQGGLALSGMTADHVLIDELVTKRVFNELMKRIERRNGTMRLTLTPINAPAEWLREECEAGRILDLHYRCEPRWCIPVGSDEPLRDPKTGEPMDARWIERFIARSDANEVEVTVHGGWQIVHVDRSFAAWSEELIWRGDSPPELEDLVLSMDYGEDPGRFVAELSARTRWKDVLVLGEWAGTGRESARSAAEGIRAMIREWGIELEAVPRWVGDVNSAGPLAGGRSMNEVMQAEFRRWAPRMEIETAFKTRGSVDTRFAMLNTAMAGRRIRVHESCRRLISSFQSHKKGKGAAYLKDPVDALWYGVEPWIREVAPLPARIRFG